MTEIINTHPQNEIQLQIAARDAEVQRLADVAGPDVASVPPESQHYDFAQSVLKDREAFVREPALSETGSARPVASEFAQVVHTLAEPSNAHRQQIAERRQIR